ncbi:MAG: ABC transporter ATP-binding protein [Chthoniobacterales bacterium]
MIRLHEVTKIYGLENADAADRVHALDHITAQIETGEFIAITGESGCGKSTLMHLLGGLDQPTSGEIHVGVTALHTATESDLTRYRRDTLGIVFQFFNLLPTMRVIENVMLPLLLQGQKPATAREQASASLEIVGMADRRQHFPHQLSGGEMQRTAIARALVHRPQLLLADEPTGNLDSRNAAIVLEVLEKIASQRIATMIIVTHSEEVARAASRRIQLRDGKIIP